MSQPKHGWEGWLLVLGVLLLMLAGLWAEQLPDLLVALLRCLGLERGWGTTYTP